MFTNHRKPIMAILSMVTAIGLYAADATFANLADYTSRHPRYTTKDVLDKTSNLRLSTDGVNVRIQLSVRDQTLQRRFLAEGISIYVDPTGKKNKTALVLFPAAMPPHDAPRPPMDEAHDGPGRMADEDGAHDTDFPTISGERSHEMQTPPPGESPIRPALLVVGNDTIVIPANSAEIAVDDNSFLTFTAVLPVSLLLKDGKPAKKWQVGLFAGEPKGDFSAHHPQGRPGDKGNGEPQGAPDKSRGGFGGGPGGGGPGGGPGGMQGRPPQGMAGTSSSNSTTSKLATSKIEQWVKVSYSDMLKD